MGSPADKERKKKNKARRAEQAQRSALAYRRRAGLKSNEEEVPLAGMIRRFFAFGIDQMFFAVFNTFCLFFLIAFYDSLDGSSPPLVALLMPQLFFGGFYWIPLISRRGQTLGLRKLKLIVIKEDGTGLLGWKESFIRWFTVFGGPTLVVMVLSPLSSEENFRNGLYLTYLLAPLAIMAPAFWTSNRQGMHDRYAQSVVVRESPLLRTDISEK